MKDQHTKIKGYRDLSQAEIDLMNEIKAKGQELEQLVAKVRSHLVAQQKQAIETEGVDTGDAELTRLETAEPQRWASMAKTDLQTGIMKLVRAVAQPTTF